MGGLISALTRRPGLPQNPSETNQIDEEEARLNQELADLEQQIANLPTEEAALEAEMIRLQAELDQAADLAAQAQELADLQAQEAQEAAEFEEIERRELILQAAQAQKDQTDADFQMELDIQRGVQGQAGSALQFGEGVYNALNAKSPEELEAEAAAARISEAKAVEDQYKGIITQLYALPQYAKDKVIQEAFFKRERAKKAYLTQNQEQVFNARTKRRPLKGQKMETGYRWNETTGKSEEYQRLGYGDLEWFDIRKYYFSDYARDMTEQWRRPVLGDIPNGAEMVNFTFEGTTYQFRRDGDFSKDNEAIPPCNSFHSNGNENPGAPRLCKKNTTYPIIAKSGDRVFQECKPGFFFQEDPISERSKCVYMGWRYADVGDSYYTPSQEIEYTIKY